MLDDNLTLRQSLLDFIADFANWDNSTVPAYSTPAATYPIRSRGLGGSPGTRPLVVDPFAGGGSIPLEALRVGADAFASDLNPVPVLLNKVVLEYIPKYGQHLADEVRKWGEWIYAQLESELREYYPKTEEGNSIGHISGHALFFRTLQERMNILLKFLCSAQCSFSKSRIATKPCGGFATISIELKQIL